MRQVQALTVRLFETRQRPAAQGGEFMVVLRTCGRSLSCRDPSTFSAQSISRPATMIVLELFLVASIGRLVAARPEPTPLANLQDRAVDCAKVTGALSALKKLGPPATTFCRSYLKVPGTSTITTTTTPTAV
jgi:hypothetical protein